MGIISLFKLFSGNKLNMPNIFQVGHLDILEQVVSLFICK
jgi:hypothetical protein